MYYWIHGIIIGIHHTIIMIRGFMDISIAHITITIGMTLGMMPGIIIHIITEVITVVIMEVLPIVIMISFLIGVLIPVGIEILEQTGELIPFMQVAPEVPTDH